MGRKGRAVQQKLAILDFLNIVLSEPCLSGLTAKVFSREGQIPVRILGLPLP